jgi:hypothetical protein
MCEPIVSTIEIARRSCAILLGMAKKLPPEVAEFFRKKQPVPPDVAEFFRKTGAEGGRARAKSITPERRAEIARKAAVTRWEKKKKEAGIVSARRQKRSQKP